MKEEPLPAGAPPLPEENQSEDTAGETDGGEILFGPIKSAVDIVASTCRNYTSNFMVYMVRLIIDEAVSYLEFIFSIKKLFGRFWAIKKTDSSIWND